MTKYMHTIKGLPGFFWNNKQICFAGRHHIELCDSLPQLRNQQELSKKFRLNRGFAPVKYSYVKVKV